MHLFLSTTEIRKITDSKKQKYYFRNGINIFDSKHSAYKFKVYVIEGISHEYMNYIEKEWRKTNSLPKLCSYKSGR